MRSTLICVLPYVGEGDVVLFEKFYTIGRTTVCVVVDQMNRRVVARGTAICSPLDEFDSEKGKRIAENRALTALHNLESTAPICPRKFHAIKEGKIVGYGKHLTEVLKLGIISKVSYLPLILTPQEVGILYEKAPNK